MSRPKVLFTHSYFLRLDPKQLQWNKPYPPLMTIQAAALLREAGWELKLFDAMFASGPGDIASHLEAFRPDLLVIFDDGFNYLTKMCLTNMREAAWEMIARARSAGCRVAVCSSDATDHYAAYLDKGADFILLGEGEQTLTELAGALTQGHSAEQIAGLAFLREEKVIRTAPRPVMSDLDELPLPAWDLVDFAPYRSCWEQHWGYFSLNIATTRGCPYHCNWCAKPLYGNSYKMRSPAHVVRELSWLAGQVGFDHIWFCDDIFGLKRSWVMEFAGLVRDAGLSFRYKIQSRADLLVKEQYIEALSSSGCEEAWMGVESGSQRILDAMEKGITIAQVREATSRLKASGIRPCFFIQFGYPGETGEDISATIRLITRLLPSDIGISVSYPLPGTRFYEQVRQDLIEKANWTDSDDLALMFRHRYPPEFYRLLHRYVHHKFRLHLAMDQWRKLLRRPFSGGFPHWKRALSLFYYAPASLAGRRRLKQVDHEAALSL